MEKEFKNLAGISLAVGAFLMVVTMLLHPAGGTVEHLLKMKSILMVSHGLAIMSMPFTLFGFWGLSNVLSSKSKISFLAFCIACFALFAAMIAGTINGLTLPLFISSITNEGIDPVTIKSILKYGSNINIAMDYIFMSGLALSILIWSALIIKQIQSLQWIGYFGFAIITIGIVSFTNGFNLVGLFGFRIVVFAIVGWIVLVAYTLLIKNTIKQ
jgi:hypothetical protein